ncbi:DUF3592 domain-containing protein [Paraburkholderia sp. MMS20-SJTR3]|uniref:DUF3592 domain-containing protein n=1 Tax=Paraburkholderia sejongensis TaxID=2886946 RepID=A0ABS8K390_9BURK|nr:DUF3592 domain-containing protein [Paraburkholderia sp. MMS20-SJTR3]MCC8396373.1 DUF3592 domain-containing protein [Paraburkholderia sp. MMS20-SJTR3]
MTRTKNYFALAVGLLCFVLTDLAANKTFNVYKSSVATTGQIVRLEPDGRHPVVEFVAISGEHREALAHTRWPVEVGQTIALRYKPDDPTYPVTFNRFVDLWLPITVFGGLTVLFMTWGLSGKKIWRRRES